MKVFDFLSNLYFFRRIVFMIYNFLVYLNFLESQTKIYDNIWIGDFSSCSNDKFLIDNKINVIINLTPNIYFTKLNNIKSFRIPAKDNHEKINNSIMIINFLKLYDDINPNGTLIHCEYGMQRSATFTALYLMKKNNLSSQDAIKLIKSKRSITFFPYPYFYEILNNFKI